MQIPWVKCGNDGHWCSLEKLNLAGLGDTEGVYVIWHEGNPARVVRIGQGDPIKDRLGAHRKDPDITHYRRFGALRVTWASVPYEYRDGVERYLAETWPPLIGEVFPDARPIAVNSPWS